MVYILHDNRTLKGGQKVTYLYLAHNIWKNGNSVREWAIPLGREKQAEEKLRAIAINQKGFHPESAENLSSALLCAYLDIFEELDLIKIVNDLTSKNRSQGLTPGHYILFCALNRLTDPKSKNLLKEWFEGTILKELYPNISESLTVQHIWNHFNEHFNPEILNSIFLSLLRKVIEIHGVSLKTLLIDPTNFYTYISDHPFNKLPKRGHGKEGKKYLNIINFALAIDKDKEYPIYFKTYPGNINDYTIFKEILPEISEWFEQLELDCPDLTVVFDKGNNSEDSIKIIEENEWGFIGSLKPSMFKELLQEPFTEFSKIYDTRKKHSVYAFRREAKVYTDKPRAVIVTFDEKVHNKNLHTLKYHITKRFDQLKEFSIHKLNTKPQWRKPKEILKHIDTQILKQKDFKKLIAIILESVIKEAVEYQELRWGLDERNFKEKTNTYGKSIIFSNKMDWTTKEIVLGYRQQYKIEKKFTDMKSYEYIRTRPFHHWTDNNLRIHVFICVLALLGQALLKTKLKELKINGSFSKNVKNLEKIHKINLFFNKGRYKKPIFPHLTKIQERLFSKLNLERYFL